MYRFYPTFNDTLAEARKTYMPVISMLVFFFFPCLVLETLTFITSSIKSEEPKGTGVPCRLPHAALHDVAKGAVRKLGGEDAC